MLGLLVFWGGMQGWAKAPQQPSPENAARQEALADPAPADACAVKILSISAARGPALAAALPALPSGAAEPAADTSPAGMPAGMPTSGWVNVSLPDRWAKRWPDFSGTVWYRVEWLACAGPALGARGEGGLNNAVPQPVAVLLTHASMAAEGGVNGDVLWRDRSLAEPLSRSWNLPRYYLLPTSLLNTGVNTSVNTLWFKVAGHANQSAGLGAVYIGAPEAIQPLYAKEQLLRRNLPFVNLIISGVLGCVFLFVWLMRTREAEYGWFALASLAWLLLGSNALVGDIWPLLQSIDWDRLIATALVLYALSLRCFVVCFGAERLGRLEQILMAAALAAIAAIMLAPGAVFPLLFQAVILCASAGVLLTCLLFPFRVMCTRRADHILMAVCMAVFQIAGIHDLMQYLQWTDGYSVTAITAPIMMIGMSLILAWRFTFNIRQIEQFYQVMEQRVAVARHQLMETLEVQHALQLSNVRLQERLSLSRDLHDGLGSALVRAIVMTEQGGERMSSANHLSLLKGLRADLRQVLDYSLAASRAVPESPCEWIAPLRRRYGMLFENAGVECTWSVVETWPQAVSTPQILALTRFLEEALTNVIKHSGASRVIVELCVQERGKAQERIWNHSYSDEAFCIRNVSGTRPIVSDEDSMRELRLSVSDNGRGIDTDPGARNPLGGIGLQSMRARVERVDGRFALQSSTQGTTVRAALPVGEREGERIMGNVKIPEDVSVPIKF